MSGNTAIDMAEKGFEDKDIKALAPLAGVVKGTLEMSSFSVLTAPMKRGFIRSVLNSSAVKTAMANGFVQYAASIGAEVTTELAQTKVDQITNDYAATIEKRPDLLLKPKELALIHRQTEQAHLTAVPLSLYNKGRHIKLEFALAKGKKQADKRQSLKARDVKREIDRTLKSQ